MGLDMFAYRTSINLSKSVDFQDEVFHLNENNENAYSKIAYWRRDYDLHDWMGSLYYEKGGTEKVFNCVPVELTLDDLSLLEKDFKHKTYGKFIKDAKKAIKEGDRVFYDSWW